MKKYIIIGIVLFISVGLNIFLISSKKIDINNYITNHQEQYQQQWSGQLLINQWASQGNTIEWKMINCNIDEVESTLNKLHPISSMYSKIIEFTHSTQVGILYPEIFTKTKDELK